jgi:acyl-coenzyme A thioesterase PaaI-like protein
VSEDALVELNERVRNLIDHVRVLDAPDDVMTAAGNAIDAVIAQLAPFAYAGPYQQSQLKAPDGSPDFIGITDPHTFFPYSPIIGDRNPVAPPVRLWLDGDRMRGQATFGAAYVGPPSVVHGGVIALTFDELLGTLGVALGVGGFTGTLRVRYERPTPLQQLVTMEAWLDRAEGRKVFLAGTICHNGAVTARAEGLFIRSVAPAPGAGT